MVHGNTPQCGMFAGTEGKQRRHHSPRGSSSTTITVIGTAVAIFDPKQLCHDSRGEPSERVEGSSTPWLVPADDISTEGSPNMTHASDSLPPPRWIVGLDLEPDGNGPVEFARWFHDTAGANRAPRFIGLHVLEGDYLHAILEEGSLEEVLANARKAVLGDIDRAWASTSFHGLDVVQGSQASRTLNKACANRHAAALVIGRHAPRKGRHLVRLGRIPRQVLREVSAPTIVVPPDFRADSAPAGAVVVATSLSEACADVATVGQSLAKQLGRPLSLVYVRTAPSRYAKRYTPASSLAAVEERLHSEAETTLTQWAAEHGVEAAQRQVVVGSVSEALVETAAKHDASMLLMGADYAPLVERAISGNVVSHVAAHAAGPVVVVPPLTAAARERWQTWPATS